MKRSEAIEKLSKVLPKWLSINVTTNFDPWIVCAHTIIDFIEKEIGMLPPSNYPMRDNEWDQE